MVCTTCFWRRPWTTALSDGVLKYLKFSSKPTVCFFDRWPQTKCKLIYDTFSDSVFYALSHGSLGFAFHGSFFNHSLIGQNSSIANKNLCIVRLIGLPWRTKPRLPCERALKTESETGVINEFTFCLGSPVKKTNSETESWDLCA